jgi:membrane protein
MSATEQPWNYVLKHPGAFFAQTLKSFRANQGLLLAGAVAYYTLLSVIPLLGMIVIALSHVIDQRELFVTLARYLEWLVPGQSKAIVSELATFVEHRDVIGWVLLMTMLFFSSLAFMVLEKAMAVIFLHRFTVRHRHFLVSAVLPYCYILLLGVGFLIITLVSGSRRRSAPKASISSVATGRSAAFPGSCCISSASAGRCSC